MRNAGRPTDGGTDLNRNFPAGWETTARRAAPSSERYGGEAPFSAAETEALRAYTLRFPFAATVSYHAYGSLIYAGIWRCAARQRPVGVACGQHFPGDRVSAGGRWCGWRGLQGLGGGRAGHPVRDGGDGCEAAPLAERELYSVFVRNRTVPDAIARWLLA